MIIFVDLVLHFIIRLRFPKYVSFLSSFLSIYSLILAIWITDPEITQGNQLEREICQRIKLFLKFLEIPYLCQIFLLISLQISFPFPFQMARFPYNKEISLQVEAPSTVFAVLSPLIAWR